MDRPHFVYPFICGVAFSLAIMNNAATNIHIQVLMWTYISLGLIPRSRNAGSHDKVLAAQSCPTLCDPMDWRPPGSSVHGILQARILERVAIFFSGGYSRPRDWTLVCYIAGWFFTTSITWEALFPFFESSTTILFEHEGRAMSLSFLSRIICGLTYSRYSINLLSE